MQLIVADTSPLVYLILIGNIEILPHLFQSVFVPDSVHTELCHALAPAPVRTWAAALPSWTRMTEVPDLPDDATLRPLGAGERATIVLALSIHADLVLMDERKGKQVAIRKGLDVAGTLGILQRAARHGLVDLAEAFDRLKRTNFRYRQEIMDKLLSEIGRH